MSVALKPHLQRVLVASSSVDETQTDSGLIVPLHSGSDQPGQLSRGVILANGTAEEALDAGTIVYYDDRHVHRVGDTVVLEPHQIWAYEEEEV